MGLETAADALILLDTCFSSATSSSLGAREIAQGSRTEIIAACGFESYAPMCPHCGFTRAFAGELRRYAQMIEIFNAAKLHHSVLDSLRWKSPVEGDCTSSTDRHGDASDICRDIPATLMYISLIRDSRVPSIPLRVMASNHIRMPPTSPSIPEAASTQLGPLTTAQTANSEQPAAIMQPPTISQPSTTMHPSTTMQPATTIQPPTTADPSSVAAQSPAIMHTSATTQTPATAQTPTTERLVDFETDVQLTLASSDSQTESDLEKDRRIFRDEFGSSTSSL